MKISILDLKVKSYAVNLIEVSTELRRVGVVLDFFSKSNFRYFSGVFCVTELSFKKTFAFFIYIYIHINQDSLVANEMYLHNFYKEPKKGITKKKSLSRWFMH